MTKPLTNIENMTHGELVKKFMEAGHSKKYAEKVAKQVIRHELKWINFGRKDCE